MKLPTKLGKEPIIDAIFELRFPPSSQTSDILPGVLFSVLKDRGEPVSIEKLPASQIPEGIRRADPNLQFSPLIKLLWGNYSILISDGSVGVACNLPYPGWQYFRTAINQVVSSLSGVGIIESLNRYSLKYVDLIQFADLKEQVLGLNIKLEIGNHKLKSEVAFVRIEIPKNEFLHIVSIQTGAIAPAKNGGFIEGAVVDVDSISNTPGLTLEKFTSEIDQRIDAIHTSNKIMFFDCLENSTVTNLDPHYD